MMRFTEIHDERMKNEEWRKFKNEEDEEDVFQVEIQENETNEKLCKEAKENELRNFDEYKVFEEVEATDKDVIGSRFVLTRKEDGTVKARFVAKGFQEMECIIISQSDRLKIVSIIFFTQLQQIKFPPWIN